MDHAGFDNFIGRSPPMRRVYRAIEAEARLPGYSWPGNVRQLQNVVRNKVVLNDGPLVTDSMLSIFDAGEKSPAAAAPPTTAHQSSRDSSAAALPDAEKAIVPLAQLERLYIERAIELCAANVQLAPRGPGISASTIYRKTEGWEA